jgi:hypothetical protein
MSELEEAIKGWEEAAQHEEAVFKGTNGRLGNLNLANTCRRAAEALRIRQRTGKVVCVCHFLPYEACRRLKGK